MYFSVNINEVTLHLLVRVVRKPSAGLSRLMLPVPQILSLTSAFTEGFHISRVRTSKLLRHYNYNRY